MTDTTALNLQAEGTALPIQHPSVGQKHAVLEHHGYRSEISTGDASSECKPQVRSGAFQPHQPSQRQNNRGSRKRPSPTKSVEPAKRACTTDTDQQNPGGDVQAKAPKLRQASLASMGISVMRGSSVRQVPPKGAHRGFRVIEVTETPLDATTMRVEDFLRVCLSLQSFAFSLEYQVRCILQCYALTLLARRRGLEGQFVGGLRMLEQGTLYSLAMITYHDTENSILSAAFT